MSPNEHIITIASEFSETPFGRYVEDGPESGQVFREKILAPALAAYSHVRLILDGVEGLPSSFWDEVMGGLIRAGWAIDDLRKKLTLEASRPDLKIYVRLGWRYAQEEADKQAT